MEATVGVRMGDDKVKAVSALSAGAGMENGIKERSVVVFYTEMGMMKSREEQLM